VTSLDGTISAEVNIIGITIPTFSLEYINNHIEQMQARPIEFFK
jgi:hypothetical protein